MRNWGAWAAALMMGLLWQGSAHAAWSQAKTQHFTVYSDGSDESLRRFAERLEKFDFLLRTVTGVTDPDIGSPVKVYILSSAAKVQKLARSKNVGGFYSTSDRSAFAVLPKGEKMHQFDMGAEEILFHEYTHHFMLHHFPAAYPAWYVEGFAEFFSVVKFTRDGNIEYGRVPMARAPGLVLGQPYPLTGLFAGGASGLKGPDMDRYYGTAWLLTHFMQYNRTGRRQELLRYLRDLSKGVPDMKPDSYFDGGLAGLEKDVRAYMRHDLSMTRMTPKDMKIGAITVTPLDPVQGDLVEQEVALDVDPTEEQRREILASIRAVVARYPGKAYPLAVLAEAEWAADQKDAALADADRAIAIDANSSRGYAVRARVLIERAHESDKPEDWKAALTAIVRANRADTEDPVPLALFYRYHLLRGGKMPDLGYDGLYKAFALLPQNAEYRLNFAQALAARGDYTQASILLNPIAYSPHGSDRRDAALRLKADYDAQAAKQPKAAVSASPPAGNPAPAS